MSRDFTFDPVWEGRAQVDGLGWTAEMRIPFSQLRFTDKPSQAWGLNLNRWVPQRNEDVYWVMVPREETGFASRFGTLEGLEGIRPARRIEAVPYVSGNANFTADPATRSSDQRRPAREPTHPAPSSPNPPRRAESPMRGR